MKCQNCGNNEVNFHYSSNVNGCVTETSLCAECAGKSGYDFGEMFDTSRFFEGFFPFFGVPGGFFTTPARRFAATPFPGLGPMFSYAARPEPFGIAMENDRSCGCDTCRTGAQSETGETDGTSETGKTGETAAEVDEEMNKRREVNMLREQMRLAAENDDFEKAIELRERIKEIEV